MFRASSAHLQEDTVVHMQHMVLSLSMRVLGGLSVHSLSSHSSCVPTGHQESDSTICCMWYCGTLDRTMCSEIDSAPESEYQGFLLG